MLPEFMTADVQPNQDAVIDTRKGLVKGHVSRISPSASNGTRAVEIALDAALPEGANAGLPVDGTIDIEKLDNVTYVGRPVHGAANSSISVFKIVNDDKEALRVNVKLGRASVQKIEVLEGLKVGDKIILSDMSEWDKVDRVHLK
jgi:multidrug efflux pump subunit AcrA (membrane-fusion protein)